MSLPPPPARPEELLLHPDAQVEHAFVERDRRRYVLQVKGRCKP